MTFIPWTDFLEPFQFHYPILAKAWLKYEQIIKNRCIIGCTYPIKYDTSFFFFNMTPLKHYFKTTLVEKKMYTRKDHNSPWHSWSALRWKVKKADY